MKPYRLRWACLTVALMTVVASSARGSGAPAPARTPDTSKAWLLHTPGISGTTDLDRGMLRGLNDGGFDGQVETYDWTGAAPGIPSLLASKRNHQEAEKIAELIAKRFHAEPDGQILVVSHSAGAGLCAWALEMLPDEVKVDTVVMLSPALSPTYDLTKALSHVRGKAYAFTSVNDYVVLGAGTSLLGTVDGKKTDAAGRVGFDLPDGADKAQYGKLVQHAYDAAWMRYDNIGDHVGYMSRSFANAVVAPLILKTLPLHDVARSATVSKPVATATTAPSATPVAGNSRLR